MGNCMAIDGDGPMAKSSARKILKVFRSSSTNSVMNNNNNNNHNHNNDIDHNNHSRISYLNGCAKPNTHHHSNSGLRQIPDLVTGDIPLTITGSSARHLTNNNNNNALACPDRCLNGAIGGSNNNLRSSDNLVNVTKSKQANNSNNNNSLAQKQQVMICLTDFVAEQEDDLSFRKGDHLLILKMPGPDWWYAEHLTTKRSGFVPRNYIAHEAIEMEEWFFSRMSRREAENLLLTRGNCRGTFLIRYSENIDTGYSLSIKDEDKEKGEHVKHYKIKTQDKGGYYIFTIKSSTLKFPTMVDLIAFYSKAANGLCYRLVKSCAKPKPSFWPDRNDKIQRNELRFIRKIGTGCFGEVYYGTYMNSKVAIKTLKQGTMSPQAFLEEAVIMRKCRHKNLVSLYGVCLQEGSLLIITEYMCNGSLLEYLRNNPEGKNLKLPDLTDMASQIAMGMAHLEQNKFIHRDLAARNILVDGNRRVKVADFGLARVIEDSEYTARQGAKFPIKWTAPEAATYGKFSIKSDVWSYGILLYELITHGSIPYAGMHNKEVIEQVQRGYRIPRPTNCDCPLEVYNKMRDCWHSDPDKRPTFDFLANFFLNYNVSSEQSYRDALDVC